MKKYHLLSIILFFVFILPSCIELNEQPSLNNKNGFIERRELMTKSIAERLSYGVTQTDVENYLVYRMSIPLDSVKGITRYIISDEEYIFIVYLINGGWYIFSGDYSTTPIIAKGDDEEFLFDGKLSRHDILWLESIKNLIVKNRNDFSLQTEQNRLIWIRAQVAAQTKQLRDEIDTMDVNIAYILDTLANDNILPLTQTHWCQYSPFNKITPVDASGQRFPIGCVAIALGQLFYYTHFTFSFPNDTYSDAYCNDLYTQTPYNYHFSSPSSSTWNSMATSPNDTTDKYASILCALINQRSGTYFGIDNSGKFAETSTDSIPKAFNAFLISGVQKNCFDRDIIASELRNYRPVVCSGEETVYEFGVGDVTTGHAYLIDGCIWLCVKETEVITDQNGLILSSNSYIIVDNLLWSVNTGISVHRAVAENSYFPDNPRIYVGWSL